jgi:hypothetical protein
LSKKTEEMRERYAYHEAGHAVMDLLLMLPFNAVSVKRVERPNYLYKNGQKLPINDMVIEGVNWTKERRESINKNVFTGILDLREALNCMAGPEAEAIFIGEIDDSVRHGATIDMEKITISCRAAISRGQPPENWKVSLMGEGIIKSIALQARDLLERNWVSVVAVADALLKYRYLSYEKVKSLMRTHV